MTIGFYLEFNYNLKFKYKKKRQRRIDNFLRDLRKIILENSELNHQKFREINQKLNKFSRIKNTKDPKEIIKFNFEIIKELSFWDENTIRDKFKLFFPEIDLSFL